MAKQKKDSGISSYVKNLEQNDLSREEMKRVAQATNPEITKVFMPAREAIEHGKDIIYPIRSGEISGFNAKKGFGFIRPDDKMNPIFMKDPERIFKQGEKVNYIEINLEALVTNKGVVSSKSIGGKTKFLFIRPATGGNVVSLSLSPTYPLMTNDGHANFADKTKPEYAVDLKKFDDGDEVEFVANTKGNVVAIKKIEK